MFVSSIGRVARGINVTCLLELILGPVAIRVSTFLHSRRYFSAMLIIGTLKLHRELGTPNREPQEYSRNIILICLPGSSTIFLLYSWGSLLGVPNKTLLLTATHKASAHAEVRHYCRSSCTQSILISKRRSLHPMPSNCHT